MHDLVESMVRGFNDLPVNVLYTATSKQVKDADGDPFIVPELTGKGDYGFSMKMVALMTCYGYMRTEVHTVPAPTEDDPKATKAVKRRVIYWEDTGTIRGKDRTVTLAPFTVNATLQQIRKAISGEMIRHGDGRIVKPANAVQRSPKADGPKKPVVQTSPPVAKVVESVAAESEGANDKSVTLETVEA